MHTCNSFAALGYERGYLEKAADSQDLQKGQKWLMVVIIVDCDQAAGATGSKAVRVVAFTGRHSSSFKI